MRSSVTFSSLGSLLFAFSLSSGVHAYGSDESPTVADDWGVGSDETAFPVPLDPNANPPPMVLKPCDPAYTEKIIHNGSYYPPPPKIKFRNWYYLANGCAPGPTNTIHYQGPTTSGRQIKSSGKMSRPATRLVIHETGGPGYGNSSTLVHFLVDDDGYVYQLMDLADWDVHSHSRWVQDNAWAIEVANGTGANGRNFISGPTASCPAGKSCVQMSGGTLTGQLVVTPSDQLANLHALVNHLLTDWSISKLHAIPRTFVNAEHVRSDGARFFLLGMNNKRLISDTPPPNCAASNRKNLSRAEQVLCSGGGILTHSIISQRNADGFHPALFLWLMDRLSAIGRADTALAESYMRCILGRPLHNVATDSELQGQLKRTYDNWTWAEINVAQVEPLVDCGALDFPGGSGTTVDQPSDQGADQPNNQATDPPAAAPEIGDGGFDWF